MSLQYFTRVQQSLNFTLDQIHSFYRLFYIPGMHHCVTGPGAWDIGQVGTGPYPSSEQKKTDSLHNALLSLVEWTESDVAPMELIGTKHVSDNRSLPNLTQQGRQ